MKLGGRPVLREGVVTDNGNVILDVHGLAIVDPAALESELNQLPGVVTNGLFARRPADVLLLGTPAGRAPHRPPALAPSRLRHNDALASAIRRRPATGGARRPAGGSPQCP